MKIQCTDKKTFELIDGSKKLGQLAYDGLFSFNAEINIGSEKYEVKPAGIFSTVITVFKDQKEVVVMHMTWKGHIVMALKNSEEFILKAKGAFLNKYVVENSEGKELMMLAPDFDWAKFSYNYDLLYEKRPDSVLLVLLAAYSSNYFIAAMSATM